MDEIILVLPEAGHEAAVADYIAEHDAAHERSLHGSARLRHSPYGEWLSAVQRSRQGMAPKGRVPATVWLGVRKSDGRIVGMIDLRHHLTPQMLDFDGHIGSGVRPSERGRGYARQMLALVLKECPKYGIERVLITCNEGNAASERTIIGAGGVFEDRRQEPNGKWVRRFWVDLKEG